MARTSTERGRAWYAANREKARAKSRAHYLANREKYIAKDRERREANKPPEPQLPVWLTGKREVPAGTVRTTHTLPPFEEVEQGIVLEIPRGRPEKRGFTQRRETMLWDAYVLHTEGWELTGVFWG